MNKASQAVLPAEPVLSEGIVAAGATITANLLTGLGIDEFFTRTDGVGSRALLPDALGTTVATTSAQTRPAGTEPTDPDLQPGSGGGKLRRRQA